MTHAARAKKARRITPAPPHSTDAGAAPDDDAAALAPGGVEPLADTTAGADARAWHGDDDVSPIDTRVRLRNVVDFELKVRTLTNGREVWEQVTDPRLTAGMSRADVGAICGPGVYWFTWYKAASGKLARMGRTPYYDQRFTLVDRRAFSGAGDAAPPPTLLAAPGAALLPAPSSVARGEAIVPSAMRIDEQWFAAVTFMQRDYFDRMVDVINNQNATLAAMANQAAAQTAQIVAMSGNLVQAMHAQSTREIDARMQLAGHIAELERGAGGSMMERTLAPIVQRMVNKFLPDTTATPDKLERMVDKVDALTPKLEQMADAVPQMQAGMRKMEGFADRASAMMGGGAPEADGATLQRTPDGPLDGAGQPAIEVPTEPELLDA